jgi:hypothetical protein
MVQKMAKKYFLLQPFWSNFFCPVKKTEFLGILQKFQQCLGSTNPYQNFCDLSIIDT